MGGEKKMNKKALLLFALGLILVVAIPAVNAEWSSCNEVWNICNPFPMYLSTRPAAYSGAECYDWESAYYYVCLNEDGTAILHMGACCWW